MASKPQLTIQVVTWNSSDDLVESLPVLASFPQDEVGIRIIDNNSADNSVVLIRQQLPQADIIELDENSGFAGGHNAGFAKCETEFVMVYNPDLKANWSGISEILGIFSDEQVGSAQGLLTRDQKIIDSAGISMTLALNGKERGAGEANSNQFSKLEEIDACTGAAAIYRISALKKVAHGEGEIFDKDFFAYKEDVDLGWRLRKAGYKNMFVPVLQGIHPRSLSSKDKIWNRMADARTRYSFRNWLWMIYKNASLIDLLKAEIFIDARLLVFFLLSLRHPSFFKVWLETLRGLPRMLKKR